MPSNIPYQKGHVPYIDAFRGIAILLIFLFHAVAVGFHDYFLPAARLFSLFRQSAIDRSFFLIYPLTFGWAGVPIFFVLSGFCIHLSHQRSKVPGWLYYTNRRFFRVYPAYFLALLLFGLIWPRLFILKPSLYGLNQFAVHALAIHNFFPWSLYGINGSFWSIAVEIQLYCIYPILLMMVSRVGWQRTLFVVFLIEFLLRAKLAFPHLGWSTPLPHAIVYSPFSYWFSWAIGAYLAQAYLENRTTFLSRIRVEVALVLAFVHPCFSFPAVALLTAILIDRFLSGRWVIPQKPFVGRVWNHLSSLGTISYSFYLFHQPIMALTGKLPALMGTRLHPLILFGCSCLWYFPIFQIASQAYRFVENPSITLGQLCWRSLNNRRLAMATLNQK